MNEKAIKYTIERDSENMLDLNLKRQNRLKGKAKLNKIKN